MRLSEDLKVILWELGTCILEWRRRLLNCSKNEIAGIREEWIVNWLNCVLQLQLLEGFDKQRGVEAQDI